MILPELHKFKKASLIIIDPSDSDLGELIYALARGQTLSSQSVRVETCKLMYSHVFSLDLSINKEPSSICIKICLLHHPDLQSFSLTFPHSEIINIDWTRLFQIIHQRDSEALLSFLHSFSNLKNMEMRVGRVTELLSVWILQMTQNCPSLTELMVEAGFLLEDGIKILQSSNTRPSCMMTLYGFICNEPSEKCTDYCDHRSRCNQKVKILLNDQGFSMKTLYRSACSYFCHG
ncbi:hypothetical protein PO909_033903 [Leuciscus waleckii]